MSRVNEGGMHFVSYHRKSKEFYKDNSYVRKNLKKILAKKNGCN